MLEKITALIKAKGLTQREVEAQLGLAENRISKWLNGSGEPKAHQVWQLARALGVSAEYLLNDEVDDPANDTGLTEDERYILKTVRSIGLTADEFARRVYGVDRKESEQPHKIVVRPKGKSDRKGSGGKTG